MEMNHEEPLTLFIVCLHSGNVPEICRSRPRAFYVMSPHISMNSRAHAPDLTSDKILAFFPLLKGIIKENSVLARIKLASNENHDKKG